MVGMRGLIPNGLYGETLQDQAGGLYQIPMPYTTFLVSITTIESGVYFASHMDNAPWIMVGLREVARGLWYANDHVVDASNKKPVYELL